MADQEEDRSSPPRRSPTGAQGDQGAQGAQGPQGPQGPPGPPGEATSSQSVSSGRVSLPIEVRASESLSLGTDEVATPSSPATPSQPTTPGIEVKVSDDAGAVDGVDSGSQVITPGTADLQFGGSAGSAFESAADVRALARLRPVEVMLRDPLGEVARKERRSLLGISAIGTLVGWTGLVPAKIENFGISFASPERKALLWIFLAVVLYYTVAFVVYALSDFLSYLYAVHQGNVALKRQRDTERGEIATSFIAPTPAKLSGDIPWSLVGYVTPASLTRGVFDFIVPLAVAGFAMWSLWGAVHQVASVPHDTAPSLKAAPAPATR